MYVNNDIAQVYPRKVAVQHAHFWMIVSPRLASKTCRDQVRATFDRGFIGPTKSYTNAVAEGYVRLYTRTLEGTLVSLNDGHLLVESFGGEINVKQWLDRAKQFIAMTLMLGCKFRNEHVATQIETVQTSPHTEWRRKQPTRGLNTLSIPVPISFKAQRKPYIMAAQECGLRMDKDTCAEAKEAFLAGRRIRYSTTYDGWWPAIDNCIAKVEWEDLA